MTTSIPPQHSDVITSEDVKGINEVIKAHGRHLCTCFLEEACIKAGRQRLIPAANVITKIAGKHMSLAYFRGHLMFAPDDGGVGPSLKRDEYETSELDILTSNLKPGDIAIDVGANVGQHSLAFYSAVKNQGSVLAIEPNKQNLEYLVKNCLLNRTTGISVVNAAAGNDVGYTKLYICEGNVGDHRVWLGNDESPRMAVNVPVQTVDNIVSEWESNTNVDTSKGVRLLKIDVQGAEIDVLFGSKSVIERSSDLLLVLEFWPHGLRGAGKHESDLFDFIDSVELLLFCIHPHKPVLVHVNRKELEKIVLEQTGDDGICHLLLNFVCMRKPTAEQVLVSLGPNGTGNMVSSARSLVN